MTKTTPRVTALRRDAHQSYRMNVKHAVTEHGKAMRALRDHVGKLGWWRPRLPLARGHEENLLEYPAGTAANVSRVTVPARPPNRLSVAVAEFGMRRSAIKREIRRAKARAGTAD